MAFKHDCDECIFLGQVPTGVYTEDDGEDILGDVYAHPPLDKDPTIIIRTGDDGANYHSFPLAIARIVGASDMWIGAVDLYDEFMANSGVRS